MSIAGWKNGVLVTVMACALAACGGGGGSKNTGAGTGTGTGTDTGAGTDTGGTGLQPASLQYLASEPDVIYLAGSPGTTRAAVQFRVLDALGRVVPGVAVSVSLADSTSGASIEGAAANGSRTVTTDADGVINVAVLSGTVPAAVRLVASVVALPQINATSVDLRIAVGRPAQRGMSLAVETFSIEGFERDGEETDLTIALADRLGNPVPDGTQVNFVTSAGVVVPPTCITTGGQSRCTVTLRSQGQRPPSGVVQVLAYTPGDEDFSDLNGNNRWDAGEPFTDLGQVYRDDNFNGAFDAGEFFVPRAGSSACAGGTAGRPGTCDGTWGTADVRALNRVVFATSQAVFGSATVAAGAGTLAVNLADRNGNSMPTGSQLTAVTGSAAPTTNCSVELPLEEVPNQLASLTLTASYRGCVAGDVIELRVTTPSGVRTAQVYVVN